MNIASALNFGLAALNFGLMVWCIVNEYATWILSLMTFVFCFCMGLACHD